MTTLNVSEIFSSIQGESHFAGYPCAFVRLTGCNLDCVYCDTRYAREGGAQMSVADIVERVATAGLPLSELTGGEPLFQPGTPELLAALQKLPGRVLLETNGSLPLDEVPPGVVIIMDLKTPGSGMEGANLWSNLNRLGREDELKVVLTDREDYEWTVSQLKEREAFGRIRVSLSPAAGLLKPEQLARWMVEDRLDARLQLQLHRIIWPAIERGV